MKKQLSTILPIFIFAIMIIVSGMIIVQATDENILDYGECGDNLIWTLSSNGVLEISGKGKMSTNWNETNRPWEYYISTIETIIISDGVESIGNYAFAYCVSLKNVKIPESVKSIGIFAFECCIDIESVTIPKNVESIGDSAFRWCANLKFAILEGDAPKFGDNVFDEAHLDFEIRYYTEIVKTDISNIDIKIEYDTSSLIYTGSQIKPVVSSAKIDDVEISDNDYTIAYGENINVSTGGGITIIAKSESKLYCGSATINFAIIKADPTVIFPDYATLTYGETLDAAVLDGESGEGSFSFMQGTKKPKVTESGDFFELKFTPADMDNYNTLKKDVPVTVMPKQLFVTDGTYAVTKVYDGTVTAGTASGFLELTGVVSGDAVNIDVGTIGTYPNANVGIDFTIALSELTLEGADMYNYTLGDNTYYFAKAAITSADYSYNVAATQNIKVGSGLWAITAVIPASVPGVNNETVSGTVTLWKDSTSGMKAQDTDINSLEIGQSITLWWSFEATTPNYTATAKMGEITFIIINSDLQTITFNTVTNDKVRVTYGDVAGLDYHAIISVGTGAVSYSSSNPTIAVANENGTLTILKAGITTITATAASVPGFWAEASVDYELTVTPKPVTITGVIAENKVYDGTNVAIPAGTAEIQGKIASDNLTVILGTAAFNDANAGDDKNVTFKGYSLDGTDKDNYILSIQPANVTANITPKPITGISIDIADEGDGELDDGDVLTAVIAGLVSDENEDSADTLTFVWNGINGVSTDKNYTISDEDVNTEITVTVKAGDNYSGIFTSLPVTITVQQQKDNDADVPNNQNVPSTPNIPNVPSGISSGASSGGGGSFSDTNTNVNVNTNANTSLSESNIKTETITADIGGRIFTATLASDGTLEILLSMEDVNKYKENTDDFVITAEKHEKIILSIPPLALEREKLEVVTDFGIITIPNGTLKALQEIFGDEPICLSITKGSFNVALKDGNGNEIVYDNAQYPFTITLPYVLAPGQKAESVIAVRKVGSKNIIIPFAIYNAETQDITFEITRTGVYDVIYNKKTYTEIPGHWAESYIDFITARGLEDYSTEGRDKFTPGQLLTRAAVTNILAKLEGIDLSGYVKSDFTDISMGHWYSKSVAWAAKAGIVKGYEDGTFKPNRFMTREEIAVILDRYIKHKRWDIKAVNKKVIFDDNEKISPWAVETVANMQQAGILNGRPGNIYDPKGITTRAEYVTIFARLIQAYSK